MQHDVVSQAWCAVDADEDAVFDGGAKTHCQAVSPCAWPLIVGPGVCDQSPSFSKDVGCASCSKKEEQLL